MPAEWPWKESASRGPVPGPSPRSRAMAPLGPAVAPGTQARDDERAYLPPMRSLKAKTRGERDRKFSRNCSISQRQDSKVKITSVCLRVADLNARAPERSPRGGRDSNYSKTS